MLFYFFIFILLLPFVCMEINKLHAKRSGAFFLFTCLFLILSFIRWNTGTDWDNYLKLFERIRVPFETLEDLEAGTEKGFMFINNFSKWISESYTLCLFLQGLLLYTFLYKGLKALSPYPLFSLLVYYSMNLAGIFFVRQTIALAISMYSVTFIIKKKPYLFVLFVLLSATIHRTAILFLIAYFVFWRRYSLKSLFLYTGMAAVSGWIIGMLVVNYLASLGLGEISSRLIKYLDSDYESAMEVSNTTFLIRGLMNRAFVFGLVYIFLSKYREKDIVFNGIFNLYIFGAILFVFVTPISRELARLTGYFDMAQLLIYPYIIYRMPAKYKQSLFCLLTVFFFYRLYVVVNQFPEAYIPYKTIFS